jgi:hypothetical protein
MDVVAEASPRHGADLSGVAARQMTPCDRPDQIGESLHQLIPQVLIGSRRGRGKLRVDKARRVASSLNGERLHHLAHPSIAPCSPRFASVWEMSAAYARTLRNFQKGVATTPRCASKTPPLVRTMSRVMSPLAPLFGRRDLSLFLD